MSLYSWQFFISCIASEMHRIYKFWASSCKKNKAKWRAGLHQESHPFTVRKATAISCVCEGVCEGVWVGVWVGVGADVGFDVGRVCGYRADRDVQASICRLYHCVIKNENMNAPILRLLGH